jgi:cytochrome c oxidase assembly protein subunit 15
MSSESHVFQNSAYKPVLFWGSLSTLIWITFLLYAGGFTTSIRAGMAFLDWPLSNGSINPEGWLENADMMAEHSHRLLGMVMGLLSIGLCIAAFATKARPRIRKLGIALVVLVITQGLLGGLRVKLDALNLDIDHNLYAQSFAVAHGTLAQLFLCLLVAFAVMSSRSWIERNAGFTARPKSSVATIGIVACVAVILHWSSHASQLRRPCYTHLSAHSLRNADPASLQFSSRYSFRPPRWGALSDGCNRHLRDRGL